MPGEAADAASASSPADLLPGPLLIHPRSRPSPPRSVSGGLSLWPRRGPTHRRRRRSMHRLQGDPTPRSQGMQNRGPSWGAATLSVTEPPK
jgi:hypothetical protein